MFIDYPPECQTENGDYCVFPFEYKEETYWKCTETGDPGKPWCATETNAYGKYNGKYGYCKRKCLGKKSTSKVSDIYHNY